MILIYLFFLILFNVIIEFLPISSTAHFLLFNKIFDLVKFDSRTINLLLSVSQLSITLYLVFYFKKYILEILRNIYKKEYFLFCIKILVTMIPSIIFGFLFYKIIKMYLYNTKYISIFLFIGSLIMLYSEKRYKNNSINSFYNISLFSCFKIGVLQMFSLIPGVSRSAMTISGGLLNNIDRGTAVSFSFFISIPISFCASFFDIYKNISIINNENLGILFYVFIFTIFFCFIFVKKIIEFLKKVKLNIFAYYRIILSLIMVTYYVIF